MLGTLAKVESRDPHIGTVISLTVSPDGVDSAEPATAFIKTDPTKVMASFCHHIFFLESPEIGAEWAAQHGEGTFFVTLDEGFALGKRLNAAQFD